MSAGKRDDSFQCGSKGYHPFPASARRLAEILTEATGERHRSYECPHCGGWHVGRPRNRRRKASA